MREGSDSRHRGLLTRLCLLVTVCLLSGSVSALVDVVAHSGPASATPQVPWLFGDWHLVDRTGSSGPKLLNGVQAASSGNWTVFASGEPANGNNGRAQIWRKNMLTGAVDMVSVTPSGVAGDADSYLPVVSSDGRYVAFQSTATNLASPAGNGSHQIYRRDMASGTTVLVSSKASGLSTDSTVPSVSDNGYVSFNSSDMGIDSTYPDPEYGPKPAPNDQEAGGSPHVFVWTGSGAAKVASRMYKTTPLVPNGQGSCGSNMTRAATFPTEVQTCTDAI